MLYDNPRNSLKATFTQVPNRSPIKPVLFLERNFPCVHRGQSVFLRVLVLQCGSIHTNKRNLIWLQNSTNTAERGGKGMETCQKIPPNSSTPRVLKLQCANFAKSVLSLPLLRKCSLKIDSGYAKGVFKGC